MEPKKKVLLKDIAREVGVSTALVSYVLNNKNENRIGKEVADKIRQVAKDLNYQPNQIARSLKNQKTHTIGLIVADIANPFSSQLARIIEDEAKKKGYTVIFGSSDENLDKSNDLIKVLLNRQVDGFIIAAVDESEAQLETLQETGVPFVLIDRYFPGKNHSYVAIDNYKAAYNAVDHLLKQGRKNIGLINYTSGLFHLGERTRGYRDAMAAHQTPANLVFDIGLQDIQQDVEDSIDRLLAANPPADGLFFATNTLAVFGLKHLLRKNIAIPERLAIVAFDETEAYDLFYVPLTFVRQPLGELGKQATIALLNMIDHGDKTTQLNLDTELVIQKSSGAS